MIWIYFIILMIFLNCIFWVYFKKKDIIYDELLNYYRLFLGYSIISLISFVDLFYDISLLKYNLMGFILGVSLLLMCEIYKIKAERLDGGYCE